MKRQRALKRLEAAAIEFHQAGIGWAEFYGEHADVIDLVAVGTPEQRRAVLDRLLAIVASGTADNAWPTPIDLVTDTGPKPPDVGTAARLLLTLPPLTAMPEGTMMPVV
jgi:hypothetical protein